MVKIIVTGCGTAVGKTVVSAILMRIFQADYWKPVQTEPDGKMIQQLCPSMADSVHPSAYDLQTPLSPHHAARLEGVKIDPARIIPPMTDRPLVIESVGGVLVPLNSAFCTLDLFQMWKARWIVVSRHYLGSINHTLLTLECLRKRGIAVDSVIFNGEPNPDSEQAILNFSKISLWARLLPEKEIDPNIIERYASLWQKSSQILL